MDKFEVQISGTNQNDLLEAAGFDDRQWHGPPDSEVKFLLYWY